MSTTDEDTRTIEWATKLFRPLLRDLDISHLETDNVRILTAEYRAFIKHHMDNCVVVVCYHKLEQNYHQGLFIWQYNEREDFYALYIVLNTNLKTMPIIRKAVSVHEYTHCVAAMLAFSRLETKALIEILHLKMSKRFHILTSIDTEKILRDLKKIHKHNKSSLDTFDDSHFRIEWEDFRASYSELYRNLLLSFELFCEDGFFDETKRNLFHECTKQKDRKKATEVLLEVIHKISNDKNLDEDFVKLRVFIKFLPLIDSCAETNNII